jgi:hypothetical protein
MFPLIVLGRDGSSLLDIRKVGAFAILGVLHPRSRLSLSLLSLSDVAGRRDLAFENIDWVVFVGFSGFSLSTCIIPGSSSEMEDDPEKQVENRLKLAPAVFDCITVVFIDSAGL